MSENEIQVNQSPNEIGSRRGTLVSDQQRTNDVTRHGKNRQRTTGTNGDANGTAINGYGNPEKLSFVQSCKDYGVLQTLRQMVQKNFKPEKRIGNAPNVVESLKAIATCSWLNVLLVCIPVSWAIHFAKPESNVLIFVFSFLAIIPLAKLLAFATDEMSMRVGQTLAGLLNATLGNAVELIVAIIAIVKCELQVVQSSLVGSILSNLLLVLGMCFFAGGTQFSEQGFGASATQINSSLLTISVIAVLLPAAFHNAVQGSSLSSGEEKNDILMMSHGVAVILLFIYASYLIFQLWSHTHLYEDKHESNFKSTRYEKKESESVKSGNTGHGGHISAAVDKLTHRFRHSDPAVDGSEKAVVGTNGEASRAEQQEPEEEEEEKPKMSFPISIGLLVVVTVFVAITAEFLVDSINGVTSGSSGLSKEWVGLILLPIVGNAAEHVTAVTVSVKDKLTLSIGVAVGSSIQIALFVIPLMVIIAWGLGKPLLLLFDPFESVTLFLAVLTVNYVVQDGKSNWLEGMILMCLYVIIAVCFWFYKGSDVTMALAQCT